MKTRIVIILMALVLIGGLFYLGYTAFNSDKSDLDSKNNNNIDQDISKGTSNINIQDFVYSPMEMRIKKGDTVTWTNKDSVRHTITSDSGDELSSKLLSEGEIYSHTFDTVGTYDYHCTPHPYMKGRIIVE